MVNGPPPGHTTPKKYASTVARDKTNPISRILSELLGPLEILFKNIQFCTILSQSVHKLKERFYQTNFLFLGHLP
jgi:hypothetical protein